MAAPASDDMSFEDDSSLLLEALNIPATHHGGGGSNNDKDCKGREYNELFCHREQTKNHWIFGNAKYFKS